LQVWIRVGEKYKKKRNKKMSWDYCDNTSKIYIVMRTASDYHIDSREPVVAYFDRRSAEEYVDKARGKGSYVSFEVVAVPYAKQTTEEQND
jgi:hypothetical protein